jgi:uncharacterized protein YbaR (Trm112 family)
MFIELIDLLRCPVEHEESWLVAAFTRMDGRFVIEGKLGCPVCSASYPITDGIARFSPAIPRTALAHDAVSADDVIRAAAMLGLTRAGMTVVLEGRDAALAPSVVEMSGARVIAVNAESPIPETEGVAAVTATGRLPVATGSVDGLLLGADAGSSMAEAARILRRGGRIVAPASIQVAAGAFRQLARDERNVVLESVGELVKLSR